jgi:Holliday junction resolvase
MEQILQSKIKLRLKAMGWIVVKTIKLSESGYPDLFCFRNGETMFIEVKDKNGIVSEIQHYRINELIKSGFKCYIIYSIEQFNGIFGN